MTTTTIKTAAPTTKTADLEVGSMNMADFFTHIASLGPSFALDPEGEEAIAASYIPCRFISESEWAAGERPNLMLEIVEAVRAWAIVNCLSKEALMARYSWAPEDANNGRYEFVATEAAKRYNNANEAAQAFEHYESTPAFVVDHETAKANAGEN